MQRGKRLSLNDVWIAATAYRHGLRVLTADGDLKEVPQVLVEYVEPMK